MFNFNYIQINGINNVPFLISFTKKNILKIQKSEKISKLEELSISMTNLIDSGNSQKIHHLEKMRQKILKDIINKKEPIDKHLESTNFKNGTFI